MRTFNGFGCFFYYIDIKDKVLKPTTATACWSGTSNWNRENMFTDGEIYIYDWCYNKTTIDDAKRIVKLINKITPCSIVDLVCKIDDKEISKEKVIKYKFFGTYDQDLILLNFIRNLWYVPTYYSYKNEEDEKKHLNGGYVSFNSHVFDNVLFFDLIKKSRGKDPLEVLTSANMECCVNSATTLGHCNVHKWKEMKVKNVESLLKYKGNSTKEFLTT